jgi:hypothetical protein
MMPPIPVQKNKVPAIHSEKLQRSIPALGLSVNSGVYVAIKEIFVEVSRIFNLFLTYF